MTGDEYGAFTLVLLLADFRTGVWKGSGVALSEHLMGWSLRKCQRILKSLERKDYVELQLSRGKKGNYPVTIHKYHDHVEKVTTILTPLLESDDTTDATLAKVTTPAPTLKEVVLRTEAKKKPAQERRGAHSREQIRQIEAKKKRLQVEEEVRRELYVGAGPVCADLEVWAEISKLAERKRL